MIDDASLPQLDDLSPEEIDALAVGIIQVDGAGRVMLYNQAESKLSGRPVTAVLGRDFFQDVAPCTNLPAFRGRFLEGVRSGHLDERFVVTFGFDQAPVRVEVQLYPARKPDRYWIVIRPLAALQPSPHRLSSVEAANTVGRRVRAEAIDPIVCEREPIHLGGAVQPHVTLLACDPDAPDLPVRACSDNTADALGGELASIVGRPLANILPQPLLAAIHDARAAGALDNPARPLRRVARLGPDAALFLTSMHLYDGRLIVELERLPEHPDDFAAATPMQAQDAITCLRVAATLEAAAAVTAREIRAMTGFERVLVYRFDPEWNGEAIAEDKAPDWDHSLLGLRFPASDIPSQARALYARSPARFVLDRDAVPAPVLSELSATNAPVDLTFAQSRALSPIHLEYQRNLGVNGSMSVSIIVEDRLWGLAIGHHRKPHYVTPDTRSLASVVTDAFALRVHELDSRRLWREQQTSLNVRNALLERIAVSDDLIGAVTGGQAGPTLLDLFASSGAAIVADGQVGTIGATPPQDALLKLADWVRHTIAPGERAFGTDRLAERYSPAAAWRPIASGLLAAFIGQDGRENLFLWFRPEVAATIVWGGNPAKPVLADTVTGTVLPRRSFERWVEERRGQADPWAPWQIDTAAAFAFGIGGIVLRQRHRIAELTTEREALARALEQKEVLAREVDHRVKNSLQIVASVMLLQGRGVIDPEARAAFEETYARVMSVARVHDSLHRSDDVESVDLGETLRSICGDLAAGMTGAAQRLDVSTEPGLIVASSTAVALSLVATELVTNALKYAYAPGEPGRVEVSVKARAPGGIELRVCDFGRGLSTDWTLHSRTGGLGMRLIRTMLEQIGAVLEVGGQEGTGACFTVSA